MYYNCRRDTILFTPIWGIGRGRQPGTKGDVTHTNRSARSISCHEIAMNMVLLINAKRAKAFTECPGLVRQMEVSVFIG